MGERPQIAFFQEQYLKIFQTASPDDDWMGLQGTAKEKTLGPNTLTQSNTALGTASTPLKSPFNHNFMVHLPEAANFFHA